MEEAKRVAKAEAQRLKELEEQERAQQKAADSLALDLMASVSAMKELAEKCADEDRKKGTKKSAATKKKRVQTKQLKKEYATMPDLISGTFSTLYGPLVPRPSVPSA